mmetsp:Transcript_44816/g.91494  ORF Transcript_44816/g.91494 Transcript_44816/m.91494 type:complete len:96 (-) Transcript_44816:724-1011(-)
MLFDMDWWGQTDRSRRLSCTFCLGRTGKSCYRELKKKYKKESTDSDPEVEWVFSRVSKLPEDGRLFCVSTVIFEEITEEIIAITLAYTKQSHLYS